MITVVTTYDIEIFKLFYTHKYHDMFRERLFLYIDKEDSSEFRKIIDPEKTTVFDKNDFKKYYGDKYLSSLSTFSKIYFINMLLKENLIDDSFYFTDDDILLYNNSFEDLKNSDKPVYSKDMFLIIDKVYQSWTNLKSYIDKNFDYKNNLGVAATNFYFPKHMISDLRTHFNKTFDEFIQILYDDKKYIDEINDKSTSKRKRAFAVFYVDTPFFNIVFPKLGLENYNLSQIYLSTYSDLRNIKNRLKTTDTKLIMERYFHKKASYPNKQPLLHYSVTNKLPLMKDCYNHLNDKELQYKNVDDILRENPREAKKLIKNIPAKTLF